MNDVEIWKQLTWDVAVKTALALLFAGAPWLGALLSPIVMMFTDKLFAVIAQIFSVSQIRMKNEEHQREFEAASIRLRQAAKGGLGSDEFKKARDDAQAALSKFVRFGAV